MGWRGTIALVLLVLFAGAYLWIAGPVKPEVPQDASNLLGEPRLRDPSKFVALVSFETSDVVALRVTHSGQTLTARRQGQTWVSTVEPALVESFLQTLTELGRIMEISATEAALHDYGLDAPQSVVELTLTHRTTPLRLEIGSQNPAATCVYVRIDKDGPVILAGSLMNWELDKLLRPLPDSVASFGAGG